LDIRSARPSCRRSLHAGRRGSRGGGGHGAVRSRSGGDLGARGVDDFIRQALAEVAAKAEPAGSRRGKLNVGGFIAFDRSPRRDDRTRVNERIRVREVRVIDEDGTQLGIMPPPQALAIARQKGLDLVEIAATAVPPVCRIMDFGRYQYQEQKRARSAKKHQKIIEVKEIKFRPKVDEHDYQFKKKHIERFLADGDKVKATIFFRGREMAHPEIGRRILERLIDDLADVATPENMPRQEGNQMHTILSQKVGGKKPAPKVAKAETVEGT
jgi:translation initiation factor IF-3